MVAGAQGARCRPAALACGSRGRPRGTAARAVVEFGMVKGDAATNSSLLPAGFLDSIGQSTELGARPQRGPAARAEPPGLALPRLEPGGRRPRADRLHGSDLRWSRDRGLRGAAPVQAPRSHRSATPSPAPCSCGRDRLSGRPERHVRDLAQRHDRRTSAGHPHGLSSSLQSSQTLAGQAAAANALASAYDSAAAQLSALRLSPADRTTNAAAGRGAAGRRGGLSESSARGDRVPTPTRTEPPARRFLPPPPRSTPRWRPSPRPATSPPRRKAPRLRAPRATPKSSATTLRDDERRRRLEVRRPERRLSGPLGLPCAAPAP